MFRAASKIKTLQQQQGRSLTRARVVVPAAIDLSSYYSALALPDRYNDRDDATNTPPPASKVDAGQLLRSFHHSRASVANNNSNASNSKGGFQFVPLGGGTRRGFATSAGDSDGQLTADNGSSSVDSTLEKLFRENEVMKGDATAVEPWVDGSVVSSGLDFVPTWYNPADQCISLILQFQEYFGVDLAVAIFGTTLLVRIAMIPIVVSGQVSASRMAHVNPELMVIRKKYEKIADPSTEDKTKMGQQVRDLFAKHGVKPARSMMAPFIQFPFFMGMFFGMKKMPDYFPEEMASGGILWFPDLTVPDPNFILPGICFLTFLGTVEMGKDQMMASNPANAPMMIMAFRGLSLMMIPICANFHTGMLCYWTVSNLFTLLQIGVLKIPPLKKAAGIWDAPKPVPGLTAVKDEGMMAAADKLLKQVQGKPTTDAGILKVHNERIESKKKVQELSRSSRDRRRRSIKKRGT